MGIAVLVFKNTYSEGSMALNIMKVARKSSLGQSIGLGLLLVAGCVGLIALMSYASL